MVEMKQCRAWRITDFNVNNAQIYRDFEKTRMAMGTETCPTTKKEHLQIFIVFTRLYTVKQMRKLIPNTHFEMSKCNDWNYELKEGNYEIEDNRKQGKRTDIEELRVQLTKKPRIRSLLEDGYVKNFQTISFAEKLLKYTEVERKIQKVNIIWLWGESGCGKTRWVFENYDNVFRPTSYKWWDGYDGHRNILVDDFRENWCTFEELLKITDIYPLRVECKGGSRQLLATTFCITSPKKPADTFTTVENIYQLMRRITKIEHFETPLPEIEFTDTE